MSMRFVLTVLDNWFSVWAASRDRRGVGASHNRGRGHQSDLRRNGQPQSFPPADFFGAGVFKQFDRLYHGNADLRGLGLPATLSYVAPDVALEYGDFDASFSALQTLYPTAVIHST